MDDKNSSIIHKDMRFRLRLVCVFVCVLRIRELWAKIKVLLLQKSVRSLLNVNTFLRDLCGKRQKTAWRADCNNIVI